MEPLSLEPLHLGLLVGLAFCSSVLGASSGFGGGLMVTPFLIPFVGVKGVVPVMTVALTLGNLSRVWVYRSDLSARFALRIMLPVVPGVMVGTIIFQKLPANAVAVIIGCFLIASVPLRRLLKRRLLQPGAKSLTIIGFGFGVLTGSTPGAGVLLLSLLLGTGLTGPALIGTDAAIGVAVSLTKVSMFSTLELLDRDRLLLGLLLGTAMFPGAYLARWILSVLLVRVHTILTEVLVVVAGISFLWRAWASA
jgi:uncharacterized protein